MRLVPRSADRYRLAAAALVLMLALGGVLGGSAADARGSGLRAGLQEEFDLPPLDNYTGLTARTANSSDGVNLRAEPGVDAELILSIPVGNVVELRVDELNTVYTDDGIRWWPVAIWDVVGWMAGMYLEDTDAALEEAGESLAGDGPEASASEDEQISDEAAAAFGAGDFVAVKTDDGGKLAMRAGPGTSESRIAWLGQGDVIQVVDGPIYEQNSPWYLITDGAINAYVFGDYLTEATDDGPAVEAPSEAAPRFYAGNAVSPVDGIDFLNVRSRVSANSARLAKLEEGSALEVVDGPFFDPEGDDWYLVELGDGTRGYVWADGLDRVPRLQLDEFKEAEVEPDDEVEPARDLAPAAPAAPAGPTGRLAYPLGGSTLTQSFGCSPFAWNQFDATLGCPYHDGIDLAAPAGTALTASDGGVVTFAGWCDCGLGYYVEVDHGGGISTVYGHMNAIYVGTGQAINQGEVLGEVGSTGFSTGPHVHFMVKLNGTPVDPLGYL